MGRIASAGRVVAARDCIVIYMVAYMDTQFSTLLPTVRGELARGSVAVGSSAAIHRE